MKRMMFNPCRIGLHVIHACESAEVLRCAICASAGRETGPSKLPGHAQDARVGGAIMPLLQGLLADHIGLQPSFVRPLLCDGYIGLYALTGAVAVRKAATA